MRRRPWPVFALLMLCAAGALVTAATPAPPSPVVTWARAADLDEIDDGVPAIVLDLAAGDVPSLAELLARGTEAQQSAAMVALGYGGGDAAIAALRAHARPGDPVSAMLCLALGQRGTAADRADLTRALDGEHIGDEWPPIVAAALALGVLRGREAVPALEHTAVDDGSSASGAAREALRWIEHGDWKVDALPATSDEDRIIAAAFRNGIPRTDETAVFNDDDRGGAWIRNGDAWRFRAGARAADGAHLGFAARLNAARTRAILSISLTFGPLNGGGYDYLLTRDAAGWRVRGVFFTWIS